MCHHLKNHVLFCTFPLSLKYIRKMNFYHFDYPFYIEMTNGLEIRNYVLISKPSL